MLKLEFDDVTSFSLGETVNDLSAYDLCVLNAETDGNWFEFGISGKYNGGFFDFFKDEIGFDILNLITK